MEKEKFKKELFNECQKNGLSINYYDQNDAIVICLNGPSNGIKLQFNYKPPFGNENIQDLVEQIRYSNRILLELNNNLERICDFKSLN